MPFPSKSRIKFMNPHHSTQSRAFHRNYTIELHNGFKRLIRVSVPSTTCEEYSHQLLFSQHEFVGN